MYRELENFRVLSLQNEQYDPYFGELLREQCREKMHHMDLAYIVRKMQSSLLLVLNGILVKETRGISAARPRLHKVIGILHLCLHAR